MRLIDADNFIEQAYPLTGVPLERIKNAPTIDPVHAAGACYCGECSCFYSPEKPWGRFGECRRCGGSRPVMHTDFCSKGEPKDIKG